MKRVAGLPRSGSSAPSTTQLLDAPSQRHSPDLLVSRVGCLRTCMHNLRRRAAVVVIDPSRGGMLVRMRAHREELSAHRSGAVARPTVCVPGPDAVAGGMSIWVLKETIVPAWYFTFGRVEQIHLQSADNISVVVPGLMKCMLRMSCVPEATARPTLAGMFSVMICPRASSWRTSSRSLRACTHPRRAPGPPCRE